MTGPVPAQVDPDLLAQRIWVGIRALVLDDDGPRRTVSEALGMSFGKVKALRRLASGPLTQRQLAAALSTDQPYTTVILDDLQARGLVTRTPHPEDRRAKLVALTPAGVAAAGRAEQLLGVPPQALSALDPADLAELDRLLAKLTHD
jgi:DNA-binding MarR family transcriptional regulator